MGIAMQTQFIDAVHESPSGEGSARLNQATKPGETSVSASTAYFDFLPAMTQSRLVEAFAIPESGIGTLALLSEIKTDLVALGKVFEVPEWTDALEKLRIAVSTKFCGDPARDLASLRSQPKNPLRGFLGPLDVKLPPDQQRAIRAARGLVSLRLLSGREQISFALSEEQRRWLAGKGPAGLSLHDIQTQKLLQIRKNYPVDSTTARLLTFVISALESKFADPFASVGRPHSFVSSTTFQQEAAISSEEDQRRSGHEKVPQDPLRGFLADTGNAGVRVFSGVPLYEGMQPFELKLIGPAIIQRWRTIASDEGIVALLTMFTRVLPSGYSQVPLSANDGAGLWIDVAAGLVCWNLDEVIAGNDDEPYKRSSKDRYVSIPLPHEVGEDLRRRAAIVGAPESLRQLFSRDLEGLAKSTGVMLRALALTSHRPTLTHLSNTWARFVLSICNDEGYASAAGIDFTVGTSANFNYLMLLGSRMSEILRTAYQQIGLSGELAAEVVPDIGSLWLPDSVQVAGFLHAALSEAGQLIRSLPKRANKKKLLSTHNKIAVRVYAVLKFLVAGRELIEETITRSRIDPVAGCLICTDKRIAPYHERRPVCVPDLVRGWILTYLSWLQLVAYRLHGEDRALSDAVVTTLDRRVDGDRQPLFFRFDDGNQVVALGSDDLSVVYTAYGIKNNGGRHFLDWLCRSVGLDSADIMGSMGRGNHGQETFGSWSAVVPLESLTACSAVTNDWLMTLSLPAPPALNPRALPARSINTNMPIYIPKLLQTRPHWTFRKKFASEPCPFKDNTLLLASFLPDIFRMWRSHAPPNGWLGVALSLILEDGVVVPAELDGFIHALQHGAVYRHQNKFFVDCISPSLGIRRVWMSSITVRLLYQLKRTPGALVDCDRINKEVDRFLSVAVPQARGRGLRFIMDCTAAYLSLRIPGLLFGWIRAFRFARTSRPETAARHLIGVIEPPKFDTRPRQRRLRSLNVIRRVLRKAGRKVQRGASHKAVLSWLLGYLKIVYADLERSSPDALSVGYLMHLCTLQENVSTVMRYEAGAREFFSKASIAIAEIGFDQVNWRALVVSCLTDDDGSRSDSPARTAVNHALQWMGLDVRTHRRAGPPPAALQYAEMPSAREVSTAISLLSAMQATPGDDWHLAATALRLILEQPHRWDAIACLRLGDMALDVADAHLAITWGAGANLKSDNALRVLLIKDPELTDNLRAICALRAARFQNDKLVPLFGDDHDPRNNDAARRIHTLITEALWHATGSPVIRPHDTRDTVISRDIHALLDPDFQDRAGKTLELRQGIFHICVQAGQSAPDISMENYCHDFDVPRRNWVTKINDAMNCSRSTTFFAKVTGVPDATYRKRCSRQKSYIPDLFENFTDRSELDSGAKVIDLSSLVTEELDHIPWRPNGSAGVPLASTAFYVGLRLLGESEQKSLMASRLPGAFARQLESGMNLVNRRRPMPLRGRKDVSRRIFADSISSTGLVIAMHAVSPPYMALSRIVASLSSIGDVWNFSNPEDILEMEPWIGVWKANGIDTEIVLKHGISSAVDSYLIDRLNASGITKCRGIPDRHFPRGSRAILRFIPARNRTYRSSPRASPQVSFSVGVCVLSLLLLNQGVTR